jgi:putative FmdB family regulatory protein
VPTYDYRCRSCGHTIEIVHSILADGPTTCEQCGGELQRVVQPAGVIFKGSGFYATDSRKAPTTDGKPSDGAGESKDTSESTGSGEPKGSRGGTDAKPSSDTGAASGSPKGAD